MTYGPGVDAFKVRQGAGYNAGIQLTGHVDCGPRYTSDVHQDGVQLQGGRNITFVDFSVGDYADGRSTCQGAGGAFFYSGASGYVPTNIDVVRGSYIACNHSLFMPGLRRRPRRALPLRPDRRQRPALRAVRRLAGLHRRRPGRDADQRHMPALERVGRSLGLTAPARRAASAGDRVP
jgi:hypothetical protein